MLLFAYRQDKKCRSQMKEVQVLEARRTAPNSRGRTRTVGGAVTVDRIRVAAYCRVSTDDDDQLGSFEFTLNDYEFFGTAVTICIYKGMEPQPLQSACFTWKKEQKR